MEPNQTILSHPNPLSAPAGPFTHFNPTQFGLFFRFKWAGPGFRVLSTPYLLTHFLSESQVSNPFCWKEKRVGKKPIPLCLENQRKGKENGFSSVFSDSFFFSDTASDS
jgi:hypothetical protein